ncbi:MAG: glycosyltransferase family 4 protein [Chloroflexota bacterium]
MRILLMNDRIPPENRGGAGIVVWRIAQALQARGHAVHVITATDKASLEETRDGIPTYHLHVQYRERFSAWFSLYNPQVNGPLKALYERIQPDVVHAHNIHHDLTYYSLALAHQHGIPAIFSSHDVMPFAYHKMSHFIDPMRCGVQSPADYKIPPFYNLKQMRFRYNPFRNLTIHTLLRRYTQIRTAPSQELCDAHHANGLPEFTCVHNGIDVQDFAVAGDVVSALRDRLGLADKKVILFAGRLTAAKGTAQLLAALAQVVENVPEAVLLVLSSVPIAEQVKDSPYAYLQDEHIVSAGWLAGDELAAAFRLAHIVTAPSIIFDTFPTVNLEAMASESVPIATCYGGSHEAIAHDETGYIINPFDTDAFAEKIVYVLTHDNVRHWMVARGYQRVIKKFSIAGQIDSYLALYDQAQATMKAGTS